MTFENLTSFGLCVKSNFGKFRRSKNNIFGNFRDSELWNLVNFGLENCSNLLKSKFRTLKIVKINIFGPFEFTKIWFYVNLRGDKMVKFKQSQALTFESFWNIVRFIENWSHPIIYFQGSNHNWINDDWNYDSRCDYKRYNSRRLDSRMSM